MIEIKRKLKEFLVFVKYAAVGITGTALDVGSLYVFVDVLNISVLVSTAISFMLAVINNFILNALWTFRNDDDSFRKQVIKFSLVSVVGLLLTEICMAFFVYLLNIWYILSKLITSIIVLTWNFLANKNWAFQDAARTVANGRDYEYDISIVIPAYNEERRIVSTLEAINAYFDRKGMTREIIVVDDGSNDNTSGVVNTLKDRIHDLNLVKYYPNRGKGYAVRTGINKSRGKYILFTDADNSTPIEEFDKFHVLFHQVKIIVGSRYMTTSNVIIKQPAYRVFIGRLGNILIRFFLFEEIKDTQCGFKAFHHTAAKDIFRRMKVNRFGFDIELLSIAYLLKYPICEVPVNWYDSRESRIRPIKDAVRTFGELLYIKLNLLSGRYK